MSLTTLPFGGPERACYGKFRYKRKKLALLAMSEQRKVDPDPTTLNVYKCVYCRWHHVGHRR